MGTAAATAIRVHATALVEDDVRLGPGCAVWDHVHIRRGASLGCECIVGGKSYIAPGVRIGNRVKINSFVYLCSGVTLEDGVMVAAAATFTNDRYPRATEPDLSRLRPSEATEATCATLVREGASVGAHAVVGCDLEIGRFAMVGMGAVVTRSVPDFLLVVGNPARPAGVVCRCGQVLERFAPGTLVPSGEAALSCPACGGAYARRGAAVIEHDGLPVACG